MKRPNHEHLSEKISSGNGQFSNVPEASFIAAPELIPPYTRVSSDPRMFMPVPIMPPSVPGVIPSNMRPQMSLPPALTPMSSGIGIAHPNMHHRLLSTVPPYAPTMPRGPPLMPPMPAIINPAMVPPMQPVPLPLTIPPHPSMAPGFYNQPVQIPMTAAPVSPVESYPGMPYPVLYPIPAFENFRIGEFIPPPAPGIPAAEVFPALLEPPQFNPSKERRRERNKLLARKTRQKKKVETENLKDRIAALALENEKLRTIIQTEIPQISAVELIQSDVSLPDNVHQLLKQMISIEEKTILTELSMKQKSFCIVNPVAKDSPIVYVSPGFVNLTGYSREECIGKNCRFLQGPETDKIEVQNINAALQADKDISAVIVNYHKDGTPFWNKLEICHLRDEKSIVRLIVGLQTKCDPLSLRVRLARQRGIFNSKLTPLTSERSTDADEENLNNHDLHDNEEIANTIVVAKPLRKSRFPDTSSSDSIPSGSDHIPWKDTDQAGALHHNNSSSNNSDTISPVSAECAHEIMFSKGKKSRISNGKEMMAANDGQESLGPDDPLYIEDDTANMIVVDSFTPKDSSTSNSETRSLADGLMISEDPTLEA